MQHAVSFNSHSLRRLRACGLAIGAAALIAASAKVQIPFWPVPMTLHTLAVLGISAAMGPRLGLAAMATYLCAGLAGLPVFSGSPERGIGLAYAVGPTGGYLLGFLVASWLTGRLAGKGGALRIAGAMMAGLAVVYALGLAWLVMFVPARSLVSVGLAPFLPGDLLKIGLGVAMICGWRNLRSGAAR
ncbi:biotin transporter BioY [Rhizobium sp. YJ-22]|uniref:biotin transporter BioY n=1 Tax=Rhizobium sp. YJ-22 TaxID=3037556 RepID=UPI002412CD0D|nr:biotin transporter BioY [Rhizobium sp. YJ-22]MDG3575617.1 biotin transporter BioY [Rhizobium sp. YJ-22]